MRPSLYGSLLGAENEYFGKETRQQLQNVFVTILPQGIITLSESEALTPAQSHSKEAPEAASWGRSGDPPAAHPLAFLLLRRAPSAVGTQDRGRHQPLKICHSALTGNPAVFGKNGAEA